MEMTRSTVNGVINKIENRNLFDRKSVRFCKGEM